MKRKCYSEEKIIRPRMPMLVPDAVNQRWSMDFVSDQLANGRRFRVLNVITTTSDRTVHWARNRLQCSQRKQPDMLNFPHDPVL